MASIPRNLVRVLTSTTGMGSSVDLGAAFSDAFLSAEESGAQDGEQVTYIIEQGLDREINRGVLSLTATVVARGTPLISKVGGTVGTNKINLLGSATVRFILSAEDFSELVASVAPGKQTIWVPSHAMIPRQTNGAAPGAIETTTNKNNYRTLDFDTTTQEFAQFSVAFPKSWNEGTVTFIPYWTHAATTTNFGVAWGLAGVARSNDDVGDVAYGTPQTSVDTGGTTNDIYVGPESSAITIDGSPAEGDLVLFQINRTVSDAGDNMAVDARLLGIQLIFTNNALTDN